MRFRVLAATAALLLSSSVAFADSGSAAGAGSAVKTAGGVIAAGGGAGAVAVVTNLFRNSSSGRVLSVTRAPEISTSGMTAGLVLMMGGILVVRGRQRAKGLAE